MCDLSFVFLKQVLLPKTHFFFIWIVLNLCNFFYWKQGLHNLHFNIKTSKFASVKTSRWYSSLKCLSQALSIRYFKTTTKCWHSHSWKNGMKFSHKFHDCYLTTLSHAKNLHEIHASHSCLLKHHEFVCTLLTSLCIHISNYVKKKIQYNKKKNIS